MPNLCVLFLRNSSYAPNTPTTVPSTVSNPCAWAPFFISPHIREIFAPHTYFILSGVLRVEQSIVCFFDYIVPLGNLFTSLHICAVGDPYTHPYFIPPLF